MHGAYIVSFILTGEVQAQLLEVRMSLTTETLQDGLADGLLRRVRELEFNFECDTPVMELMLVRSK